jgi:ADP-ribosyl-[dinitrogen reductase] hydrolase
LHTITFLHVISYFRNVIYFFGEVYIQLFRAAGTLVGLAIGDAFGAPLEGMPCPVKKVRDMGYSYERGRKPGVFTDDTGQALAVARSLNRCRGFSPEDMMGELVSAYCSDPGVYGPTSRTVFDLVLLGMDRREAARAAHEMNGHSRSNGSVMRGPPIGVFYAGHMVEDCSRACSRLTHYDPVAGACSAFVNRMVSDLCREKGKEEAYLRALSRCRDGEVYDMLGRFRRNDPVPGLDCLLATHAALTVFMEHDTFEETLVSAVNLGGDADTVGAISGSLAGSHYGLSAIPGRWLAGLHGLSRVTSAAWNLWNAASE